MAEGMTTLDQISRIEGDESGWWGLMAITAFFASLFEFMVVGG